MTPPLAAPQCNVHYIMVGHFCDVLADFDGDGYLNASDMETALRYITNNELEQEELDYLTSKIIGMSGKGSCRAVETV